MKRSLSIFTPLLVGGIFVALAISENQAQKDAQAARAAAKKDAEFAAAKEAAAAAAEAAPEPLDATELAAQVAPSPLELGRNRFAKMPDGSPVPPLPSGAPQRVKFGVAVFRYKGSQSPPPATRSREEALGLAQKAIEAGREDFDAAVALGDQGSDDNLGWMQRGVLEPSVEHAIFTLEKGAITTEPVDTPRGFWVAKRLR